ncbi:tRNA (adenosine(37)-N6)-threonylcarbamoyltransferase complex dimerization subunit type 1 TsaB [uncultured Tateyamaria sp.]|uniref:tRNA (adenosine(37)-N6)-threonylcarbamoyltransferase complex dimerization subunit type 1 TsaB n=1 Tax=uncultured Tateyamaria sp. TaxID=455651 RepID=UPI002613FAD8|nr:tRNA (adenosine(37)-N6)-threonylcarbamoyltransferase complex dimerization subunit type 1 TsaB [uncultured Tateyamaria sp.]
MTDLPLILGLDTSGPHCAAALIRGPEVLAAQGEDMARGQAERLMPLLEEALEAGGATWRDLSALAVGTGPGNFTGIRIGVSAARGLALGLAVPAYGVTGFEARARLAAPGETVTVPAPRGMVYVMDATGAHQVPLDSVDHPAPPVSTALLAQAIAQAAAARWPTAAPSPAPFYVRPPDAAPGRDAPPVLLP